MPIRLDLARTALSNCSGRRRLIDLFLRLNSKRTGTISEKSYSLRSALSTKASASASVLNFGNFFFMGFNLLPVHVTCADGPDQKIFPFLPESKNNKHVPPFRRDSHGTQPLF